MHLFELIEMLISCNYLIKTVIYHDRKMYEIPGRYS